MRKLFKRNVTVDHSKAVAMLNTQLLQKLQIIAEQQEKIANLEARVKELTLHTAASFPVVDVMEACASAPWSSKKTHRTFKTNNDCIIRFEGTVYPDTYGFASGCNVYVDFPNGKTRTLHEITSRSVAPGKKKVLEFGSIDNVSSWLNDNATYLQEI